MRQLINTIRHAVLAQRVTTAESSYLSAITDNARRRAEANYHGIMEQHFAKTAAQIDPNTDWWDFARNKQKTVDHAQCRRLELSKADTHNARANALANKLYLLREALQRLEQDDG